MMKDDRFLKRWALPLSMLTGVVGYFAAIAMRLPQGVYADANRVIAVVQPALLFMMLFLSFCRIRPQELRLCRWHLPLLLMQTGLFAVLALLIILRPDIEGRIVYESAMLCLICPTATAAAVVVRKLGGNAAHLVTYTVMINMVVSIVVPLVAPLIHPQEGLSFVRAFTTIMARVFPLLICPMLLAWIIRYTLPRLNDLLLRTGDLPFYLWTISLSLAIAVSTRSIVHSTAGFWHLAAIALVSLACCLFQFWAGRKAGGSDAITAGQSMGQKNTVFLIWLSYTFFTPVTAIAGGFYCIWHNVINAIQLNKKNN